MSLVDHISWGTLLAFLTAYGAWGASGGLLIALIVCRSRRSKAAITIDDYQILHTWWGRIKNAVWAVVAAVTAYVIIQALDIDAHAGALIDFLKSTITEIPKASQHQP